MNDLDNIGFDDIGFSRTPPFKYSRMPSPPRCAPHIARNMTHVSVFPLLFPRAPWVMVRSIFTLPGTHLSWFILLMTVTLFPISRPHLCYQHLCSLLLSSSLSIASCLSCTDCHPLLSCAAAPPRAPPRATHSGVMSLLLNHNTLPPNPATSHMLYISPSVEVSGILLTEPGPNMTLSVSSHWFEL